MPFKSKRALANKRNFEQNREKILETRRLNNLKRLGSLANFEFTRRSSDKANFYIKHFVIPKFYCEKFPVEPIKRKLEKEERQNEENNDEIPLNQLPDPNSQVAKRYAARRMREEFQSLGFLDFYKFYRLISSERKPTYRKAEIEDEDENSVQQIKELELPSDLSNGSRQQILSDLVICLRRSLRQHRNIINEWSCLNVDNRIIIGKV